MRFFITQIKSARQKSYSGKNYDSNYRIEYFEWQKKLGHEAKLNRIQRDPHFLCPQLVFRRYHQHAKAVALSFNPHAFGVVNQ